MASQPLAFAELLAGGVLVAAALTGSKVADVIGGKAGPFRGFSVADALAATPAQAGGQAAAGNAIAGSPVPGEKPHAATHQTAGLPGYPAFDYLAPAGSEVVAPASGTIVRLSGHDPAAGPTGGVHGPFGLSLYLRTDAGVTYYLTHLGSLLVKAGQRVAQGAPIATVGDYAKFGGVDHVHQGVNR